MSWQKRTYVLSVCLIAALSIAAFGQSTSGELVGTIYDPAGAVVPNATVVANNASTGVSVEALSTTTGQYRISNLPVGRYKLEVTATGFTKVEVNNLNKMLLAGWGLYLSSDIQIAAGGTCYCNVGVEIL